MERLWDWRDPAGVPTAVRQVSGMDVGLGAAVDGSAVSIAVLVFPGFSLLSLTAFLKPFQKANAILGVKRFGWTIVSATGEAVECSLGTMMRVDGRFADFLPRTASSRAPDILVMIANGVDEGQIASELKSLVRFCLRRDTQVVALGTATWLLAAMGALGERKCTIHWQEMAAFVETFHEPKTTSAIFTGDRGIWTCAGELSSFDLAVALLERLSGTHLTPEICKHCVAPTARDETHRQAGGATSDLSGASGKLLQAVDLMERHIDEPIPLTSVAEFLGISRRQLERLFEAQLGLSPHKHYLALRLERARRLVEGTRKPLVDIAVACGFVSTSHFSKCYRQHHGCSPTQTRTDRQRAQQMTRNRSGSFRLAC